jgi:hypothetical protein
VNSRCSKRHLVRACHYGIDVFVVDGRVCYMGLCCCVDQGGYECLVHLTAPAVRVPARRLSASTIVCENFSVTSHHYSYSVVCRESAVLLSRC